MRAAALVVCLLGSVFGAGITGAQPADHEAEAHRHFEAGVKLVKDGRYPEAIEELKQAYLLFPRPELLFNIGQAYRFDQQWELALRSYQSYLREAPDAPNRAQVEQWIRDLQAKPASGRGVDHGREGAPPPAVGAAPAADEPVPVGRALRLSGAAVGGAGLVSLATALFFAARASSTWDTLNAEAAEGGATWTADHLARYDRAVGDETRAWVFGLAGVALAGGGGVLYWLGLRSTPTLTLTLTPTEAAVSVGVSVH